MFEKASCCVDVETKNNLFCENEKLKLSYDSNGKFSIKLIDCGKVLELSPDESRQLYTFMRMVYEES